MLKRSTKEEFVNRSNEIFGFKYNYDQSEYVNNYTPVIIDCPIHGTFSKTPANHIFQKKGCPVWSKEEHDKKRFLTLDEFKEKANEIYDFKYDYTESVYIDYNTPIKIKCPEHG